MVVDPENHLFIGMSHPADGELHIHAGVPEHNAEGTAEIVRADGPLLPVHEAEGVRFLLLPWARRRWPALLHAAPEPKAAKKWPAIC